MKKKMTTALLCLCMIVTLLPQTAMATGNGTAIQLGGGAVRTGVNTSSAATVFYGQNSYGQAYGWRVVGDGSSGVTTAEGTFVFLSKNSLSASAFKANLSSNSYANSDLQAAIEIIAGSFSVAEKDSILPRTLINIYGNEESIEGPEVSNAFLWPLSTAEANKLSDSLRATSDEWWLRSAGLLDNRIVPVSGNGTVFLTGYILNQVLGVRPALRFNPDNVLLSSAAAGGKVSDAVGADALQQIAAYTGTDWKLTVKDSARVGYFSAGLSSGGSSASVTPGGAVYIDYSNANTGSNEYLSALMTDAGGNILYYGRIVDLYHANSAAQNQKITIPATLPPGSYTLKIFNEQCNGDYKTDYSGGFFDIPLLVAPPDTTAPTLSAGSVHRSSDTDATVKFTSNEAGQYYYEVVDAADDDPTIDTTGTGTSCDTAEQTISFNTLTAGAKDIYIVAKDAAGRVSEKLKMVVPAYNPPAIHVVFSNLTANGSDTETTTKLALSFDQDIPDLCADDIHLVGASKGILTKEAGTGVYSLWIANIEVSDEEYVTVTVSKTGYAFTPASLNATVRVSTPPNSYTVNASKMIGAGSDVLETGANTSRAATVYYGEDSGAPYSWRVVGYNGSGAATTSGSITLLAKDTLGNSIFNVSSNQYSGSFLKIAVEAIANRLSTEEKAAICLRTLATGAYSPVTPYSDGIEGSPVSDALLWPLSTAEADGINGELRKAANSWWLRSPCRLADAAAVVTYAGHVNNYGIPVFSNYGVRPAFHLNPSSVLFTSAAEGGKSSNNVGAGALTLVPDYSGGEWKLTLKDSSRSAFRAGISGGASSATVAQGGNISIDYANARTAANEYISAIITDSRGNLLYYGHIANNSSSGMAEAITIPAALPAGSYTLKIFNEQCNGDKKTDYASDFKEIALTVTDPTTNVATSALAADGSDTETTTKLTLSFDQDIPDLSVDDIHIVGATKGTLSKETGIGVYTLGILDIKVSDKKYIKVSVAKTGYTFTPTSLNVTVRVSSPPISYSIQASASPTAYGSVTGGGSVTAGSLVTLQAAANNGYHFVKWTEGGADISTDNPYAFTANANRTLLAVFEENSSGGSGSDSMTPKPKTIYRFTEGEKGLENPFTDVSPSDCFYDDVMFVYNRRIMAGTTTISFSPHSAATRGMVATILWRMAGSPVVTGTSPYTDVASGKYYTDAVIWTTQRGIFSGYENKTFRAEESISREQLAAIFYHYAKYRGYDPSAKGDLKNFTDKQEVSTWAQEAVSWAVGSGLISNRGDQILDPKATATRAEIAAMLHRFIQKYDLLEGIAPGGQMGWIKKIAIPKTGENSRSVLFSCFLLLAAMALAEILIYHKSKHL